MSAHIFEVADPAAIITIDGLTVRLAFNFEDKTKAERFLADMLRAYNAGEETTITFSNPMWNYTGKK